MDEELFFAGLDFFEDSNVTELLEVYGRGLAFG